MSCLNRPLKQATHGLQEMPLSIRMFMAPLDVALNGGAVNLRD